MIFRTPLTMRCEESSVDRTAIVRAVSNNQYVKSKSHMCVRKKNNRNSWIIWQSFRLKRLKFNYIIALAYHIALADTFFCHLIADVELQTHWQSEKYRFNFLGFTHNIYFLFWGIHFFCWRGPTEFNETNTKENCFYRDDEVRLGFFVVFF